MTADTAAPNLLPCPFCGGNTYSFVTDQGDKWGHVQCGCGVSGPEVRTSYDVNGPWKNDAINEWNTRATPTPTEARERIARLVFSAMLDNPTNGDFDERVTKRNRIASEVADAILALLPDAAAIRADWHTTGWDRARNSGRILLVWREFAGISEHVELGWYSDSKSAWVNTYGHPFHGDPDGWAPLLPFKTKSAIRAAAFEEAAAEVKYIAENSGEHTIREKASAMLQAAAQEPTCK